jgi:signal transduction histidine kinase
MMRALAGRARAGGTRPGWTVDLALAALASALLVLITAHLPDAGNRPVDAAAYALVIVAGVSVGFCRRWPRLALSVVIVVIGCYVARHYPNGPVLGTGLIALLSLSWHTDRRSTIVGAVALCAVIGITGGIAGGGATVPAFFFLGWSVAVVFLGDALRNRRDYLRERQDRAGTLERTREQEALRRIAEDRLRIARDLHDGVAHAMATINVQAGAAAHVIDRQPEAAKQALLAIRQASSDVLDELTAMLLLLREGEETADRAPVPGLDQLAPLVEATRGANLAVSLTFDGPTASVSRPVGMAAYRIVQESLTNVLRHADATKARVTVRAGSDRSLMVEVCDDGSGRAAGSPSAGTGIGIRGMRERAASTGGQVDARPEPSGGFTVRASWDAHA